MKRRNRSWRRAATGTGRRLYLHRGSNTPHAAPDPRSPVPPPPSRNRLKVYKGYFLIVVRDFREAASLFLETVSTFTSTELMSYTSFVGMTVLVSVIALERTELQDKVG